MTNVMEKEKEWEQGKGNQEFWRAGIEEQVKFETEWVR